MKLLKFTRDVSLLVTGIAASVVISWWLKQRERAHPSPAHLSSTPVSLPTTDENNLQIPLPPSAFADIDELPTDNIINASELPVDLTKDSPPNGRGPHTHTNGDKDKAATKVQTETTKSTDDLTTIKGIGAKTVAVLAGLGIYNFSDLAKADAGQIKNALGRISLESVETWIKTAKEHTKVS
jgi:predicted flap endonuclease-1-like 5' DNA nuclease